MLTKSISQKNAITHIIKDIKITSKYERFFKFLYPHLFTSYKYTESKLTLKKRKRYEGKIIIIKTIKPLNENK